MMDELTDRFSRQYYPLREEFVVDSLEIPRTEQTIPSPAPVDPESTEEEISSPPLRLSQGGLIIRVYNPEQELVYESASSSIGFRASDSFQIHTVEGRHGDAFSGISPVYSNLSDERIGYVQIINSLESYHQLSDSILLAILVTGAIALVFSAVFGYFIARKFLQPIRELTSAMNSIRKDPESDERIDVGDGNDELTELANAYNSMLDRMQQNIDNQKQFVEDVSHELRTPVAVVEGHLKLLDRWGKDDPQILDESIQASVQEIGRMKSLVQEMLDLSRAEQVDIHYKDEKTDVREMVDVTYTNFKLVHPEFTFLLDVDIRGQVFVNMYRNHLEQVLIILLDNAVKYSTDRTEVHLSLSVDGPNVQIAVQDYGEGMTEEDTEKIFNRFYRVDKARSRHKGGNGLGLSIAKQLIEGYGGKIWAESVLNHGSIFRIVLPVLEMEVEEPQDEQDKRE
jgi:signal transduction histidine kinase